VSERFLAELEGGRANISVARLQDVARALGSSAGELLFSAQHERTERRVIALVGLRGAGKSTIGPALAARLGVAFVELDALVEKDGVRRFRSFSFPRSSLQPFRQIKTIIAVVINVPALSFTGLPIGRQAAGDAPAA